jgi:hypothetical protein
VHSRTGFADLNGTHDVGVLDPLTIAGLAKETRNRRSVLAKLLAQHLDGNGSMFCVLGAEDGRSAAFTDLALERIPSNRLTYKIFTWHAANLIVRHG